MLNLAQPILEAVRAGVISPTNAVLINRQLSQWHEMLIAKSEGMSKQELSNLIKQLKQLETGQDLGEKKDKVETKPLEEIVFERIKVVKRKKSLLNKQKVQSRLAKIAKLLEEIEAMTKES